MKTINLILILLSILSVSDSAYSDTPNALEQILDVCGDQLKNCEIGVYRSDKIQSPQNRPMDNDKNQTYILMPKPRVDYFVPYKQNYILFGSRDDASGIRRDGKIQVSMKHTLYDDGSARKHFKEKFYMGYSYKTVWRVWEPSSPFEDHNFDLDFFYCSDEYNCDALKVDLPAYQYRYYVGFQHESNGRDKTDSRSWNRFYGCVVTWQGRHAYSGKLWWITQHGKTNSDIKEYLGIGQLQYDYRGDQLVSFTANVGRRGSLLADWSMKSGKTSTLHYYVQAFAGYGETLLDYNEKRYALRVGIRLYQ